MVIPRKVIARLGYDVPDNVPSHACIMLIYRPVVVLIYRPVVVLIYRPVVVLIYRPVVN